MPAATVTEAGTVAAEVSELDRLTTTELPVFTVPVKTAVPVDDVPPVTLVGLALTLLTTGANTFKVVVLLVAPCVAVIVTAASEATASVVTVNVLEFVPAVTVTEAGTVAADVLLLDKLTVTLEPVATLPSSVTVPVLLVPPVTLPGLTLTLVTTGVFTVSVVVLLVLPDLEAVMVDVACAETGTVVTVNVVELLPEGTVTEAGTVVAELLSERLTTAPPAGALPESVTVPVLEVPPGTEVGFTETEESVCACAKLPTLHSKANIVIDNSSHAFAGRVVPL